MQKDTGASVRIYNLSKGLAGLGNQVELILPKYVESCECIDGVTVQSYKGFFPTKFLKLISKFLGVLRPTTLFFYDPLFIKKASQIIRKADIVQFEQQSAGLLLIPIVAKVFRKPVVIDCHDTFQALRVKNTNFMRKIFETSIEKIIYRFASVILVVSEKEKQFLCSLGINQSCIEVIPNGVDTKYFEKSSKLMDAKEKYGLDGFRTVVFVGNLSYVPNREAIQLLSSVIAPKVSEKNKKVKFLVVGKLQNKIELPGLVFTGFVDNIWKSSAFRM